MILLFFATGLISLSVTGQNELDRSHRYADTVKFLPVNPQDAERYRYYNDDTRLNFDITNDSSNIYLVFKIWDEMTQLKIMRAGLKISLKTKAKPGRDVSIQYPLGNQHEADNGLPKQNQKTGKQEIRSQFLVQNTLFKADGFAFSNGLIPTRDDDKGLHAAVQWDNSNNMIYTVRIPFKELFGYPYDIRLISKKEIKLEVEENAVQRPASDGNEHSMREHGGGGDGGGGMRPGGMGGHGGGRRPGGSGVQSQGQDRSQMFSAKSFTQKFKLFTK